ncbi:gfo/Idh/MocA family oxidoreductase [Paenibacillus sp. LMG 31456]|uniref:Gfo/Idh/MocA family oxidoreductase n=1 Tax=Paenibacillus foliorum TaxID=2654974 RepID=A0A972K2P6_9BACL|nr:Gfo/Idh/MocA family oxidoreductase [Paenibacillus foliorum]NOU96130.1 gfo/Idh/MocA family oxidoreductase [Paenibacillus foliorum]
MAKKTSFSIIGGGFRSEFYLRIAKELSDQFRISGMVVRDADKGQHFEQQWNLTTYRTVVELLENEQPDFVVVSVDRAICPEYLFALAERGIPALTETPPAGDLEGLLALHELTLSGARIQVAEQYHFQPLHAARLALIESGRLGTVSEAYVSAAHGYHGVNLLRKTLGYGYGEVTIRAMRFESPLMGGPTRSGPPIEETLITTKRDLAWIDFGGKLGVFDFSSDQYRSWIRSNYVSVRGERGEIIDQRANLLLDYATPQHLDFNRINKGEDGNLEGYFLQGIMVGDQWVYRNPFAPYRLFDDEIAVATSLAKMADYAAGGPDFYGLPDASQDHYIGLMIEQAITTGETVKTSIQPWANS